MILLLFICNCGIIEGQLDILKNAIEQAVDSQMYPLAKNGTIAGHLHILKNAIKKAVDSHTYP